MNNLSKIRKQLKQKAIKKFDSSKLANRAEKIKLQLLKEFETHKVTVEIKSGPTGSNISKTLSGAGGGNLYSFIGFSKDQQDPTKVIFDLLSSIKIEINNRSDSFILRVKMPTVFDIWEATPMPWQEGRSWAKGIESGISGLNFYLFSNRGFEDSRSGTAVQSTKVRGFARYVPTQYISTLLKKYKKKFSSISKNSKEISVTIEE
jgi:hypothetical protein